MLALPPIFFYAIGTLLVVFGALRAVVLGRRRADREHHRLTRPNAPRTRRRHLADGRDLGGDGRVPDCVDPAGILGSRH